MEGAPDPSLSHDDSPGDARCTLDHHPDPCNFKSAKNGDCTIYSTGTRYKESGDATIDENPADLTKKLEALDNLTVKSDKMEGNLARVEGSLGQLTSEMGRIVQMLGKLTKSGPNPSSSLADNLVSGTPTPDLSGLQLEAAAFPQNKVDQESISGLAQDLVNSNQASEKPPPQVTGYTGQTLPEMRKDTALADIVRSELGRILSTMPTLQKAPDANTSNAPVRPTQQQAIQEQLLKFQAAQQEQLKKFAADQQAQLEAFQKQLGLQSPTAVLHTKPLQPQPLQPTQLSEGRDHPAYLAMGGQPERPAEQAQAGALAMDMETLLGLTVRCKQFRPYEFAKRTQLFYANSITERNCNFPCYILGYLRHCLILMSGMVPSSENEISGRLTNLMNICEIAANNSNLSDFDCPGWQIGKAYGDRVFHDMETGRRTWDDLPAHILPDIFLHARDTVAMRSAKNPKKDTEDKKKGKKKGEGNKACSTYNTFRTGDGCAYEWSNADKKCEFEHYCKKCYQKSGKKERHKALNCEVEADPPKKEE